MFFDNIIVLWKDLWTKEILHVKLAFFFYIHVYGACENFVSVFKPIILLSDKCRAVQTFLHKIWCF